MKGVYIYGYTVCSMFYTSGLLAEKTHDTSNACSTSSIQK